MPPIDLDALLRLPADERIELAMALWDSLTDDQRGAAFELDAETRAELDRRLAEDQANPGSAILWEDVRKSLRGKK